MDRRCQRGARSTQSRTLVTASCEKKRASERADAQKRSGDFTADLPSYPLLPVPHSVVSLENKGKTRTWTRREEFFQRPLRSRKSRREVPLAVQLHSDSASRIESCRDGDVVKTGNKRSFQSRVSPRPSLISTPCLIRRTFYRTRAPLQRVHAFAL